MSYGWSLHYGNTADQARLQDRVWDTASAVYCNKQSFLQYVTETIDEYIQNVEPKPTLICSLDETLLDSMQEFEYILTGNEGTWAFWIARHVIHN